MKKFVQLERNFCDVCGADAASYSACQNCGKDFCWECAKTYAKEYQSGVHFSSGTDLKLCLQCDHELTAKADPKIRAFHAIQALRNEAKGWGESFDARRKEAEEAVKKYAR